MLKTQLLRCQWLEENKQSYKTGKDAFTWYFGPGLGVRVYGTFQQSIAKAFQITVKTETRQCYKQISFGLAEKPEIHYPPKYKCRSYEHNQYKHAIQSINVK
jgi:hypothetical protein